MSEIADVVCCSAVEIIGERHLMPTDTTIAAGIEVPSTSPIFLAAVGLHVLMGLACVVAGVVAMLSPARQAAIRHLAQSNFGVRWWSLLRRRDFL